MKKIGCLYLLTFLKNIIEVFSRVILSRCQTILWIYRYFIKMNRESSFEWTLWLEYRSLMCWFIWGIHSESDNDNMMIVSKEWW